ncbi:SymE family type I addiction module toxin [Runella salmonicolor]|uniref:Type I toxin-antitoxin system SymE family toxin n=1 Tax=Runella salmonicolor TaxID=2950278 RepID=A0ABT1FRW1_9BACT|nr:SymE family type I addiction module toxin [Runella salmonicolor]MCP1384446.1 type I toxin-antitoxin system SymE family toxin [Runella salmonicolor]
MTRILKVSKSARINVRRKVKWVPELRLSGKWLALAGIEPGDVVEITVLNGQIIINNG